MPEPSEIARSAIDAFIDQVCGYKSWTGLKDLDREELLTLKDDAVSVALLTNGCKETPAP